MGDYIVLTILTIVIIAILIYLYRAKKNGQICIGCPHSKQCAEKSCSACGGSCNGCSSNKNI